MTAHFGEWLGAAFIVLMVAAVIVSLRRNMRDIEAFEHGDLKELGLCIPGHRKQWLEKKMAKLGWERVSEEPDEKFPSILRIRFRMAGGDARPLKEVLSSLNRSLILPISPLNLHREEAPE